MRSGSLRHARRDGAHARWDRVIHSDRHSPKAQLHINEANADPGCPDGTERFALRYADNLTYVTAEEPLPPDDCIPARFRPAETWGNMFQPMNKLTNMIVGELSEALCKQSARYRHLVSDLKGNSKLLITAIAGWIAGTLGIAVAVVAALVAALLRLALVIGVSVFCKQWKASTARHKDGGVPRTI